MLQTSSTLRTAIEENRNVIEQILNLLNPNFLNKKNKEENSIELTKLRELFKTNINNIGFLNDFDVFEWLAAEQEKKELIEAFGVGRVTNLLENPKVIAEIRQVTRGLGRTWMALPGRGNALSSKKARMQAVEQQMENERLAIERKKKDGKQATSEAEWVPSEGGKKSRKSKKRRKTRKGKKGKKRRTKRR
tara:strand:- start:1929 stop:2501 length:573 start_codon:yes stop_codon:yes gene_type:complete